MKTSIVPAQITTVEDKVAGNLSLAQMLLLAAPMFGGSALYVILPPSLEAAPYKIAIIAGISIIFSSLAIRIKGKIVLTWVVILLRYNARPRYYVYNKNDSYLRNAERPTPPKTSFKITTPKPAIPKSVVELPISESVKLKNAITDPNAKLHFRTDKKGGLRVYITEVK